MAHVYSLTQLTGSRRNEDRRTVLFTFEVRQYTVWVVALSALASAPVTLLLIAIIGMYGLFFPIVAVMAGLILWDTRQRSGLKLRTYQAILDRRRAQNGVLYASGAPIPRAELIMHQMVVIPAQSPALAPTLTKPVRSAPSDLSSAKGLFDA